MRNMKAVKSNYFWLAKNGRQNPRILPEIMLGVIRAFLFVARG
ncbi:hypothetical protein [Aggregatibacter kilianii]|nr:hypothetical protein [Aggregatibacter kilianii]